MGVVRMAAGEPAAGGNVFVAGLDPARVPWRLDALGPRFCVLEGRAAGHALLSRLRHARGSLALLGPWLPDFPVPDLVRRIRADPETRLVSIVALVLDGQDEVSGANSVLPVSTDTGTLERCVARLRSVPPRVRIAARVRGFTVVGKRPFFGLTHDLSLSGMRLLSRDYVNPGTELDLWLELPSGGNVPAMARVVRRDLQLSFPTDYRGRSYGVEFVYVPPAAEEAIQKLIDGGRLSRQVEDTLRSGLCTYEILSPIRRGMVWEAEVWRVQGRDARGERFFTVSRPTQRGAVREARELLLFWTLVRSGSCAFQA
jgi:hypothetical protein